MKNQIAIYMFCLGRSDNDDDDLLMVMQFGWRWIKEKYDEKKILVLKNIDFMITVGSVHVVLSMFSVGPNHHCS